MTKTDTWRRLAVETSKGVTLLLDPSQVFYLEVDGHDTLVRTARRGPYRSTRRIADLLARLRTPRRSSATATNAARTSRSPWPIVEVRS